MFIKSELVSSLEQRCSALRSKLAETEAEFIKTFSEECGFTVGARVDVRVSEEWEKLERWEPRIITNIIVDKAGDISFCTSKDLGKHGWGMPILWFGFPSFDRVKLRKSEAA